MGDVLTGRLVRPDGTTAGGEGDGEHLVSPGLCDLQVNGACGVEALDGGAALDVIDAELARRGVLRWLAALPTAEEARIERALDAIAERAADPAHGLLGAHVEGPFLSRAHAGVHRPELLRDPAGGVPGYYDHPAVRLVTLAPELPGALELVDRLARRGVAVALGHSAADAATATRALDAGARLVTHVFNAMAPLHHRAPGLVGVALTDPRALPCVSADGLHVDPVALRLLRAAAGDRTVLVSDASAAAAAAPGSYALAGTEVRRDAAGAVRAPDGRLAGSGILLDDAVRGWIAHAGASAAEALAAASWRPLAAIGAPVPLHDELPVDRVLSRADGRVVRVIRAQ